MASRCFIFMYFLLPHCVPATWRSRAQTSISSAADAVHPSDPFHLVLGFQSFGYALGFLHLLDQPVEHCTCNCAHFLQVGIQRSLKQHAGIEPRFVIPEVYLLLHSPKMPICGRSGAVRFGSRYAPSCRYVPSIASKIICIANPPCLIPAVILL